MMTLALLVVAGVMALGLLYLGRGYAAWTSAAVIALLAWAQAGVGSPLLFAGSLLALIALAVVFGSRSLRQRFVTAPLLPRIARMLPRMGDTERVALEAGTVWWDGELFSSDPDWDALLRFPTAKLSERERSFLDGPVETLCGMLDDWEITQAGDLPPEVWEFLKTERFFGLIIPEEYGGLGFSGLAHSAVVTKLASRSLTAAVTAMVPNSLGPAELLLHYGTEQQKRHYLPRLASGQEIPCFALTGPEAGSDAAAQTTVAVDKGDAWEISGTKNWITNGPVADVCVLMAMTDREQGHRGITAFILPMDAPGVSTSPPDDKLGIRGSKSCQIFLEEVRLPKDALLGEVGKGFKVAMSTLDGGRIGIAAQALGIARACLEDGLDYALQRRTFGKPIAEHQSIQWKLADMATEVDAARLLILKAAHLKDKGEPYGKAAAIAKLFASDIANKAGRECIQIFGGNGYVTEYPAERHFRDAKITEIYEGTSEIQRLVITNYMRKGA